MHTSIRSSLGGLAVAAALIGLVSTTFGHFPPARPPRWSPPTPDDPAAREPVTVELLADTTAIEPGEKFHLAVAFKIRKEWTISWQHAGDGRQPTEVNISAPQGFEVGDIQYPVPTRSEDDAAEPVYSDEVVLFVPITPPDYLEPGDDARFIVRATWQSRKDSKRNDGEKILTIQLPIADREHPREKANEERFAPFQALLPKELNKAKGVELEWLGPVFEPKLHITVDEADRVDFFPIPVEHTRYAGYLVLNDANGEGSWLVELSYRFLPFGQQVRPRARGVLMMERDDQVMAFTVDHVWENPGATAQTKQ